MKKNRRQNPVAEAMRKRYATQETEMRDKRDRRPKDSKRSWKREVWE